MSHFCPQCNFEMKDSGTEICPQCGFDFNDTLSCPYKISRRCIHTRKECLVHGLQYEDCELYLNKSGIKRQ